jgi:hypothetical protein
MEKLAAPTKFTSLAENVFEAKMSYLCYQDCIEKH